MNSGWRPVILFTLCLAMCLAISSGCGSGTTKDTSNKRGKGESPASAAQPTGDESSAASGLRQRTVDELPPVGDYLPPLDGGKVEVAGPASWNLLPRDSKYLVRFVKACGHEPLVLSISASSS